MEDKYKDWLDGFGKVISEQLGKEIKENILDKCRKCKNISNDKEMAACIRYLMETFDGAIPDKAKRSGVMEIMGSYCYNTHFAKIAENIKKKSNGIAEIVQNLNNHMGGEHFIIQEDKVYSNLDQCFCQVGVKERDAPISRTYCSCLLGWMKSLFKTLLDKPVKVEMLETIISGGKHANL